MPNRFEAMISDYVGPETLQQLYELFDYDIEDVEDMIHCDSLIGDEWLEHTFGMYQNEALWDRLWRFGIIVDDTSQQKLGCLWQPDGVLVASGYYVPDDEDTSVPLVTIDNPPSVDVAWDSKAA